KVPGRLHRAFDPASAAELLDIVLMPDAYRRLRADDWLGRLVGRLMEPICETQPVMTEDGSAVILRAIDEQGVYPARRLMLCLALVSGKTENLPALLLEVAQLATPQLIWTQRLDSRTRMGTGQAMADPEAAALFTMLVRHLFITEK